MYIKSNFGKQVVGVKTNIPLNGVDDLTFHKSIEIHNNLKNKNIPKKHKEPIKNKDLVEITKDKIHNKKLKQSGRKNQKTTEQAGRKNQKNQKIGN